MKRVLLFLSVFSLVSFSEINETRTTVQISPMSTLCVEGKTNVNEFNCDFDVATINSKIPVTYKSRGESVDFSNASLILNNDCFDCGSRGINKDFKKLLKTETHPQIILTLNNLFLKTDYKNTVEASVSIKMAGVEKQYNIPVELNQKDNFDVKGQMSLNISDFNLEPPQKMLGLIKVKNVITINFNLIFEGSI